MDSLSPRARALLEAAYGADDPGPGDALRVRHAVLARASAAGLGAILLSWTLPRAQALFAAAAPKVVTIAAVALGGTLLYQRAHEPASHAPVAPAVAHRPAPLVSSPSIPRPAPITVSELPVEPEPPKAVRARPRKVAVAPPADLEAEMRWVRAADTALRSRDALLASSLLDGHAREFPNGVLAEEREGLRLLAACQTGREDGIRLAERFLERAPRSLLAGRLRAACPQIVRDRAAKSERDTDPR